MKSQKELSLGLKICTQSGEIVNLFTFYCRVVINKVEYLKIKINPQDSFEIKSLLNRIDKCRCSLEWIYIPTSNIAIKEGVSIEDL
jgi:hypothetical protein